MLALGPILESVLHMSELCLHQMKLASAQNKLASDKVGKATRLLASRMEEQTKPTRVLKGAIKSIEASTRALARFHTLNLWQVVMLVTCVESYLQDVLASAANADPEFMEKSGQSAVYAEVIVAKSVEALANEMRVSWAKGWVNARRPTSWIEGLSNMGAKGYPPDLAPRLERIWDIRNAVVHKAGVADTHFVKRQPGVVKAVGDRVRVSHNDINKFAADVSEFLGPTDRWFLDRCPSLLAATE